MNNGDQGRGDPLAEAIKIINRLLDLATRRGFRREAYGILLGKKLPEPVKRPRGAPRKKTTQYKRALGMLLELEADAGGRRGAPSRLARKLAEPDAAERKRNAAWRSDKEKHTRSVQNDLSRLS